MNHTKKTTSTWLRNLIDLVPSAIATELARMIIAETFRRLIG